MVSMMKAAEYIRTLSGGTYTLEEALDAVDYLNTLPTDINAQIHWVDSKTGNPVAIGRCGGGRPTRSKKEKPTKIINPFTHLTQKQIFRNLSKTHSRKW